MNNKNVKKVMDIVDNLVDNFITTITYKSTKEDCINIGDAYIENNVVYLLDSNHKFWAIDLKEKSPTVICISGKAQNGKDTTATYLYDYLTKKGKKSVIIHYADLLKFICQKYFRWNGVKDDNGRTLLQKVGTDIVRKREPNYWVDFVTGLIKLFKDEWDFVLIPDTRFPNELSCITNANLKLKHIRVTRPNFKSPLSEEQQKHPSETALDNTVADYNLINDSTLNDLYKKIEKIGEELLNEQTGN